MLISDTLPHTPCFVRSGSASRVAISLGILDAPGTNRTCDPLLRSPIQGRDEEPE